MSDDIRRRPYAPHNYLRTANQDTFLFSYLPLTEPGYEVPPSRLSWEKILGREPGSVA